MVAIRKNVRDDLTARLNRGFLTPHAFEVAFNSPNGWVVQFTLKDNREFRCIIEQPQAKTNPTVSWKVTVCPGVYFIDAEATLCNDFPSAINQIVPWLDRIMQEHMVAASTDPEAISRMRQNLEETADALPEPDQPFSADELKKWTARFDEVVQRVESVEKDHKLQHSKVEQLRQQLEALKAQGSTLPKKSWLKSAGYRVLELLGSGSDEAIKSLASGTIKMLLGNDNGPDK
jgi:hypothetical protein